MVKKHHDEDAKTDVVDQPANENQNSIYGVNSKSDQNLTDQQQKQKVNTQEQQNQIQMENLNQDNLVKAEDMKGTITDPVSYSNPAYDPSEDAQKVDVPSQDKDKDLGTHRFKPGHFYKKGDVVEYLGVEFEALQDIHGDLPPSLWSPKK